MEFFKKIILYFIGNMASKIMTALMIPIYAFYVSAYDLGAYDYSQTIMQLAVPIIYVAIWEAILKYVISLEDKEKKKHYLGTAIFISFISTIFMVIFMILFYFFVHIQYPILVCIMMIAYTYSMILQYCSRSLKANTAYVLSGISATLVNFIFILIFVVILKKGLWGLYIAYILGQLASCLVSFFKLKFWTKFAYIHFNWKIAKILLKFSVPLAINITSGWLINGIGKIIINMELGNVANGIYSYANKFGNLVTMVTNVISMALMEEFYIRINDKNINSYFREKCNQIWEIILSIFALVIPLIGIYYFLIQNTEYYISLKYVPVCVMTACMSSFATNVGGVFQIKDIAHYVFITTLSGGIVTIIISVLFIEKYGIMGVVIAQLMGAATLMLTRYVVAHKLMKYSMNYCKTGVLLGLICLDSFLLFFIKKIYIEIIFFIVNMVVVLLFNRDFLKLVKKKLEKKK